MEVNSIEDLTKEQLIELLKIYAKNWLAHDGCWFLSIEEKFGIDTAIEIDRESWRKFSAIEANRIKEFLHLNTNSGIEGLKKALNFRLYATINESEIELCTEDTLIYSVKTCRVQEARRRKGLKDFPCKSVGIVEYSVFAKSIDDRITTTCLSCPPEINDNNVYCKWKFVLKKEE